MPQFKKSLFIFRRDLRLDDNTGLAAALSSSRTVAPCFIFDPRQIKHNDYKSDHALQFMQESLADLAQAVRRRGGRLFLFCGEAEKVVAKIVAQEGVDAVFVNRDYTPFSVSRDLALQKICEKRDVAFFSTGDALLHEPGQVVKEGGGIYMVFGAFFRKAQTIAVRPPTDIAVGNLWREKISGVLDQPPKDARVKPNPLSAETGGRSRALGILRDLKRFKDYARERDIPSVTGTTRLSAHLKFGTCSAREVFYAIRKTLGNNHPLIRQLYWRDFFSHIAFYFPHVFGHAFYEEYDQLPWDNDRKKFQLWCAGQTGVPIVDAGMRELKETGFMHNRVRMITASFLVKDLHIDWRWGEKYFAQQLFDYDPAVNNGNWQWVASTGCDVQPYFRIFNPWLQQKRYDPEAVYIKKWVPELSGLSPKEVHQLEEWVSFRPAQYPAPLVRHRAESERAKNVFLRLRRG